MYLEKTIITLVSQLLLASIAWSTLTEYKCLSVPIETKCLIQSILYSPGDNVSFPSGYQYMRLGLGRYNLEDNSKVSVFDTALYTAMNRPKAVEATKLGMMHLILPPELEFGMFGDNLIASIEITPGAKYDIRFLDLDYNYLHSIQNISALTELETLWLQHNSIRDPLNVEALAPLKKLRHLSLSVNFFRQSLSMSYFPASLVTLDLSRMTQLNSVNFSGTSLPNLETLNLAQNALYHIDPNEVLTVAPKLKRIYLEGNYFPTSEVEFITEFFYKHNVTVSISPGTKDCQPDEILIEGVCHRMQNDRPKSISALKITVFVIIAITLGALYVTAAYVVFKKVVLSVRR